jgi:ATP-dependent RNA helicase DeaD
MEEINAENGEENYISPLDFSAALLKMMAEPAGTDAVAGAKAEEAMGPEEGETGAEDGYVRLFINVGSKDRIQPGNIVQSIASTSGLPGKLIGAIDIFETYTFVEVPREYAHKVLDSMKDYTLKGRKVNIERSNKRPAAVGRKHVKGRKRMS